MGKPYKPRKRHGGDACEKRFSYLNRSQKNGFALKKRLRKLCIPPCVLSFRCILLPTDAHTILHVRAT